jgi:hypothetical protein
VSRPIIFSAPQGWGKSLRAKVLQAEFRCTSFVDEWLPTMPLKAGALHLTSMRADQVRAALPTGDDTLIISRGWFMRRQAGRALVQVALALAFFTLTLGWLGPAIDADPYPVPEASLEPGTAERLEAEARQYCDRAAGRNSGWIELDDGQIACTTKRGKRLKSTITVLHRSER